MQEDFYKKSKQSLEEKAKRIDIDLASQFVVESMSDFGYAPSADFSDDENTARLQRQYEHFCLMAKTNLVMDSISPRLMPNPLMPALKSHIKKYILEIKNKDNVAMKVLFDGSELKYIIHQISMLAFHANIKRVVDIMHLTTRERFALINPEQVALSIGLYVYFTILANANFTSRDFNKLFVESWFRYYENLPARLLMFRMRGNAWKDDFKGVLLAD